MVKGKKKATNVRKKVLVLAELEVARPKPQKSKIKWG
jgi:hypothetical protein